MAATRSQSLPSRAGLLWAVRDLQNHVEQMERNKLNDEHVKARDESIAKLSCLLEKEKRDNHDLKAELEKNKEETMKAMKDNEEAMKAMEKAMKDNLEKAMKDNEESMKAMEKGMKEKQDIITEEFEKAKKDFLLTSSFLAQSIRNLEAMNVELVTGWLEGLAE